MRVLMLSKACIVGIYQRKLELIAEAGVELLTLVPPSWKDERGETPLERAYTRGYTLAVTPIRLNGSFHLHYYPELVRHMRRFRPDLVHIDEEPYNVSAWQALWAARSVGARAIFFSWQNIVRQYPPPFRWGEAYVLRHSAGAIAGTESAAAVWRAKGYTQPIAVIPQFGTDPDVFAPPAAPRPPRPFTIGYVGRLVEEKGIDTLIGACARLGDDWRLHIVGSGPDRERLAGLAAALDVSAHVRFAAPVPSVAIAGVYQDFDALVLPSRTRPNWKEQFGRVLVEAMMSGVPVVGSDSGAIPDVIGGAGLVFAEGDAAALAGALERLRADADLHRALSRDGRASAVARFTHAQVARESVTFYEKCLK